MRENLNHVCDNCGKGVQYAHKVSHAKNRTKTIKKPNLHSARVIVNGKKMRQRLCTKCLRKAERPHKVAVDSRQISRSKIYDVSGEPRDTNM